MKILSFEPKRELSLICDFLDLEFEEEMLHYYTTTSKDGLEPEEYLAWKKKNLQPLQKDEVNKYNQLSNNELENFIQIADVIFKKI